MSFKKIERQVMPLQPAEQRRHNFNEVALGYGEEIALKEAQRCLGCKNSPCRKGCPVDIDIKAFIAQIKQKNYNKAFQIIR
ncbi:MAG: hypothetical protein DRP78_01535, partial [Candidatus Omnitrophota bacterium]